MRKTLWVMALGALLAMAAPRPVAAAPEYVRDFGLGMAAIGSNIFYVPAKMLYAAGGCIVGTLGYALTAGNLDAAQNIWGPSVGGTWILTPEMMAGKQPILFTGESYEPQDQPAR